MDDLQIETLLAFAATCLVIELTPGPNMGYLAILSASQGRRAGFLATLGIALGLLIVGVASALGLTAIVTATPWLYEALRWAGALYLVWIAWEGWRGAEETSPGNARDDSDGAQYFVRGLVTNLLNPKAGLFYISVMPAFMLAERPVITQAVALTIIYVAIATLIHVTIVLLADAARPWLEDDRRSTLVRRILSALLFVIACWLLFATRRVS